MGYNDKTFGDGAYVQSDAERTWTRADRVGEAIKAAQEDRVEENHVNIGVETAIAELLDGRKEASVDYGTTVVAQQLQIRREKWKAKLDELPGPKAEGVDFPYASMDAAVKDDFKLMFGGKDEAFRLLVKGWKTRAWRKRADKNRVMRDDLAEGVVNPKLVR